MKHITILLLSFFLIAGCTLDDADPVVFSTGSADFSTYVAVGGNLSSGFQSGALTEMHKQFSYPAQIARQAGVDDFTQPLLDYPGIGSYTPIGAGILQLESLLPLALVPAFYSDYSSFDSASPYISDEIKNLPHPYHNLSMPGVLLADLLESVTTEESFSQSQFIDLILRNRDKAAGSRKTLVGQVAELDPTFITCWIGNSDLLAYALLGGTVEEVLTSETDFEFLYKELLDSLSATGAEIVVANLASYRNVAYFTTIPPYLFNFTTLEPVLDENDERIPLVGVGENDLVLFSAIDTLSRGTGIPEANGGKGDPLPDAFYLDQDEQDVLNTQLIAFNAIIENEARARDIPVVDMYNFMAGVNVSGINITGHSFDGAFITGGFFSLDGLHATDAGNALIANEWIATINAHFDADIPPANVINAMGN
jgi:hypothetical protein